MYTYILNVYRHISRITVRATLALLGMFEILLNEILHTHVMYTYTLNVHRHIQRITLRVTLALLGTLTQATQIILCAYRETHHRKGHSRSLSYLL